MSGIVRACFAAALAALVAGCAARTEPTTQRPGLVVLLVIDGFPQWQLDATRGALGPDGLGRFLDHGAVYEQAHHEHAHTVTCTGHAAMATGAHPRRTGLVGNEWRDPDTGAWTYCVGDPAHRYIGHTPERLEGTSPRNLRVPTLADVLRERAPAAKAIAISGKDRGAIPLAGRGGVAYAYRWATGQFASTTYYMREHPGWVASWNRDRVPGTLAELDGDTLDFARAAIAGESLGRDEVPDFLAVSLSAQDSVNHASGAESDEAREQLLRTDRHIAAFLAHLDQVVGRGRYVVALTSDHGFTPLPERSIAQGAGGGRLPSRVVAQAANEAVASRWGPGNWVFGLSASAVKFNRRLVEQRGLPLAELVEVARAAIVRLEPVAAAYTRAELLAGTRAGEPHFEAMQRTFHPDVSGEIQVALKPRWIFSSGTTGTTHGAPHEHDAHVPLLLYGPPWVRPGRVGSRVAIVDLAPTLAAILGIPPPPASEGRPLPSP